jgi:predicted lipoprotein
MKKIILPFLAASLFFMACKKDSTGDTPDTQDFNALQTSVINDFVNKVALPGYQQLQTKANTLNSAVIALNTTTSEGNLDAARIAWKDMRSTWEQCEGFLFGPVEDNEYDPETDTWPVDYIQMDSLLNSTNALTVNDINELSVRSLKGYHPIEYILFGEDGQRTAASLTDRQKLYVVSLSQHLKNVADALNNDWAAAGGNYAKEITTAGQSGNTLFPKKQNVFIAINEGMLAICDEVANGKMFEPFVATDPSIVESPFSGNSAIDFKNNIIGAYNVYLGKFSEDGAGFDELVKAKNISLDNEIKQKFEAAIGSFDNITVPYEEAIATQRVQCQNVMNAINELSETLDSKLSPFIIQYIND